MSIRQDVNIGAYNMCRLAHHDSAKVAKFWKDATDKGIVLQARGYCDGGYIVVMYQGNEIGQEFYGNNPTPLWYKIKEILNLEKCPDQTE